MGMFRQGDSKVWPGKRFPEFCVVSKQEDDNPKWKENRHLRGRQIPPRLTVGQGDAEDDHGARAGREGEGDGLVLEGSKPRNPDAKGLRST